MDDNKEVYSTVEFDSWSNREQLDSHERFLIETYLDKNSKTLDAGTGGGRILHAMQDMGFTSLFGFDFVPEFVQVARQRDSSKRIQFAVQDATSLSYKDCTFDQIIYLQQLISLIESEEDRRKAVKEAYRILRPGGTAIFSFLSFEARVATVAYRAFILYLNMIRRFSRSSKPLQYLPWLRLGGRFNFGAFRDARPYVYWFKIEEAAALLEEAGFHLRVIGSGRQIDEGEAHHTCAKLAGKPLSGMLFCICSK